MPSLVDSKAQVLDSGRNHPDQAKKTAKLYWLKEKEKLFIVFLWYKFQITFV